MNGSTSICGYFKSQKMKFKYVMRSSEQKEKGEKLREKLEYSHAA